VLLPARAPLLEAVKNQGAQREDKGAHGASDDADFRALRKGFPAVADAAWGFDFLEDFGLAATVAFVSMELVWGWGRPT
jgi:hypothetical protein